MPPFRVRREVGKHGGGAPKSGVCNLLGAHRHVKRGQSFRDITLQTYLSSLLFGKARRNHLGTGMHLRRVAVSLSRAQMPLVSQAVLPSLAPPQVSPLDFSQFAPMSKSAVASQLVSVSQADDVAAPHGAIVAESAFLGFSFRTSTRDTEPTPDVLQEIRDTLAAVESRARLDRCLHACTWPVRRPRKRGAALQISTRRS